jgi:PAT family acetyl-CoA transporter-like MFS transporter 1
MPIGFYAGFTVFLALNSLEFCNKHIYATPQNAPVITMEQFFVLWGFLNFSINAWILIFKNEVGDHQTGKEIEVEEPLGVKEVYGLVWKLFQLPHFRSFAVILLLMNIGVFMSTFILPLELIDKGFSQTQLAMLAAYFLPIEIISTVIVTKYFLRENPLKVYMNAYFAHLVLAIFELMLLNSIT